MKAFEIANLVGERLIHDRPYLEFLREAAMSAGIYVLPAGGVDRQAPHSEDEIYYVVRGQGVINVGGEDREVYPGSVVFVNAGVEHYFHFITEELVILVVFAPAEGSNSP